MGGGHESYPTVGGEGVAHPSEAVSSFSVQNRGSCLDLPRALHLAKAKLLGGVPPQRNLKWLQDPRFDLQLFSSIASILCSSVFLLDFGCHNCCKQRKRRYLAPTVSPSPRSKFQNLLELDLFSFFLSQCGILQCQEDLMPLL